MQLIYVSVVFAFNLTSYSITIVSFSSSFSYKTFTEQINTQNVEDWLQKCEEEENGEKN